jgi:hypothetical protein
MPEVEVPRQDLLHLISSFSLNKSLVSLNKTFPLESRRAASHSEEPSAGTRACVAPVCGFAMRILRS